jgi:hypothetical protein
MLDWRNLSSKIALLIILKKKSASPLLNTIIDPSGDVVELGRFQNKK